MKSQFFELATIESVYAAAPWACEVVPTDGGFHAFESMDDYNRWLANTDFELTDIVLPGGQGIGVLLTEGMSTPSGCIYGVFDNANDAKATNADELAIATVGSAMLSAEQIAIARRNTERLGLLAN